MQQISEEYIFKQSIHQSLGREDLLLKKYDHYLAQLKDRELHEMLTEFKQTALVHTEILRDKMLKIGCNEDAFQ